MQTPIKEVIDAIENQSRRIPSSPDDVGRGIIADIIGNLALGNGGRIREMTFAQLIERLETASAKRRGCPSPEKRGAASSLNKSSPAVTE
jgi:hypothetical protein